MAVDNIRLESDNRKGRKCSLREKGKLLQIVIPVAVRLRPAEIALIINKIKGYSLIDILQDTHITDLSQIIHVKMINILHLVSPVFPDTQILGDHHPNVEIFLIKTFRKRTHYVCQTASLNKWNCF